MERGNFLNEKVVPGDYVVICVHVDNRLREFESYLGRVVSSGVDAKFVYIECEVNPRLSGKYTGYIGNRYNHHNIVAYDIMDFAELSGLSGLDIVGSVRMMSKDHESAMDFFLDRLED